MKIEYKSISETGKVRKNNEDHIFCDAAKGIFAVADGMGGGAQGEKASEIVCNELGNTKDSEKFSARIDAIGVSLATANRTIYDYAKENGFKQMGSTVALIVFEGGDSKRAAICHIGDSRVYRIRGGVAELFTCDHSLGAELAATLGEC